MKHGFLDRASVSSSFLYGARILLKGKYEKNPCKTGGWRETSGGMKTKSAAPDPVDQPSGLKPASPKPEAAKPEGLPMGRRLVFELSGISALVFFPLGFYQPFFPLWLSGQHLDAEAIGLVMAMPTILRVISSPTLSGLADRHIAPRYLLVVFSVLACLGWLTLSQMHSFMAVVVIVSLSTTLMLAMLPLCEVMTLDAIRAHAQLRYGRLRVWGSLSFMAANMGGGFFIAAPSGQNVPYVLAFLCGLTGLFGLFMQTGLTLPGRMTASQSHAVKPLPRRLYVLLLGLAAINASYAVLNGFGPVLWLEQGFAASDVGWLTASSVIAEVYIFIKIGGASSPKRALLFMFLGALAGMLRWSMMAMVGTLVWVAASQVLHALSYGLFHLGALAMVTHLAPFERRARAQGLMSASNGLFYAMTMLAAGPLVSQFGVGAYWAMVPCVALGLVLIFVACRPVFVRTES